MICSYVAAPSNLTYSHNRNIPEPAGLTELIRILWAQSLIDRVEKNLGYDSYLDFLRASVSLRQQDHASTLGYLERAIESEPDYEPAYGEKLRVLTMQKKYDKAVEWLDTMCEKLKREPAELVLLTPEYSEFMQSNEYRQWRKLKESK